LNFPCCGIGGNITWSEGPQPAYKIILPSECQDISLGPNWF
jgi:hypothetical protein